MQKQRVLALPFLTFAALPVNYSPLQPPPACSLAAYYGYLNSGRQERGAQSCQRSPSSLPHPVKDFGALRSHCQEGHPPGVLPTKQSSLLLPVHAL